MLGFHPVRIVCSKGIVNAMNTLNALFSLSNCSELQVKSDQTMELSTQLLLLLRKVLVAQLSILVVTRYTTSWN